MHPASLRDPHMRTVIKPRTINERWARIERLIETKLRVPPTVLRFLVVGGIGYLINQIFLFLLYDTSVGGFLPDKEAEGDILFFTHDDMRLLLASIIAVEISIVSNFVWHDRWTFRDRHKSPLLLRYLQFNATSLGSPLISVGAVNILTPYLGINHLIANTFGVLLGTSWNWLFNTRLIWRKGQNRRQSLETVGK